MLEKRKYQRRDLMQIVQYALTPLDSDTILKGVIKDYSHSGICLIAPQVLEEGQEIIVSSFVMPSSKKGVVKWQQAYGDANYKVGLEFTQ
jgi:PilZ domain